MGMIGWEGFVRWLLMETFYVFFSLPFTAIYGIYIRFMCFLIEMQWFWLDFNRFSEISRNFPTLELVCGFSWIFCWRPLMSIDVHWRPLMSIDVHWRPLTYYLVPSTYLVPSNYLVPSTSLGTKWYVNGRQWTSMDVIGRQWTSMARLRINKRSPLKAI